MPGVSTKIICAHDKVLTPRIRVRVVCGLGLTIASLAPTRAFSNVDLPTFGRPTKATKPQRNCSSSEDVGVCSTNLHSGQRSALSSQQERAKRPNSKDSGRFTFHADRCPLTADCSSPLSREIRRPSLADHGDLDLTGVRHLAFDFLRYLASE